MNKTSKVHNLVFYTKANTFSMSMHYGLHTNNERISIQSCKNWSFREIIAIKFQIV